MPGFCIIPLMVKQRIAVIVYHTCPLAEEEGKEAGGMNVYVLELSKQLAQKGYALDIYTRKQSEKEAEIVQVSKNLRVIHLSAGEEVYIPTKKLHKYIPEFLENFYAFIKREGIRYDLINCHYYLSGLIGLDIKRKHKIPFTITFHSLALMKNLVARDADEKEDFRRIRAELLLTKHADKIIATSFTDAAYLNSLYDCPKEKIAVITPGVDTNVFKPIDKQKAKQFIKADVKHKIVLFVGRIVPLKGIDSLLYATKILQKRNPKLNVCLWIVGGNGNKEKNRSKELNELERLRETLNAQTTVNFVGRQTQNDLPYYYNASEVVVMPSYYESFGIVALESMACGIPIITTDAAGAAELFAENDYLIASSNNPLLLAEKIKHLLEDKNDYQNLSKDIFSRAQTLSWENIASKFAEAVLKEN